MQTTNTDISCILISLSLWVGLITEFMIKRDDFSLTIVSYPFLDGDVSLSRSYGDYISERVRFTRVCINVFE